MDIERNVLQASSDIRGAIARGCCGSDKISPVQRADVPKATWADFSCYFGKWKNGKILLGTAYSWFALDVSWIYMLSLLAHWLIRVQIAFYGLGLNSSTILPDIFNFRKRTLYGRLYNTCLANLILSVAGLIPGYWATFLCIDSWGRKPIQLMGFSVLTILFIVMGMLTVAWFTLKSQAWIII